MAVKTRTQGKTDAGLRMPDNTTKEIDAVDVRESAYDLWDSLVSKKGDTGIQASLSYSTDLVFVSNTELVSKKYVDDTISVTLTGYLPLTGTGAGSMSGNIDMGMNAIQRVTFLTDSADNAVLGLDDRFLYDNTGLNNLARFADPAQGFGVKTSAFYANLKTTNLSADRDYEFPDYDFAFPASAPGSNTFLKYDGANYVWAAGGGSGITSVNGDSGPSVTITVTGTTNRVTVSGGTGIIPTIDIAATYVGQSSITTLGTITSGTWNATVVTGQYGGTGVANTGKTITISGNFTTTGAFNLTIAVPQTTTYTLPNTANETLAGLGTSQTFTEVNTFSNATSSTTTTTGAVVITGGLGIGDSVNIGGTVTASADTDSTHIFGRTRIYAATTDTLMIAHYDITSTSGYAVKQSSAGATIVNGSSLGLSINNSQILAVNANSLTFSNSINMAFNTSTGTKIATATGQKFAFWNKTPIVQPTTGIIAATFVANTSLIANDTATFGGYTIGQIAAALINVGILA